ncbi:MAG: Polysaccharide ABC superfamily ATP binding cassette transporter permease [candidate division WS6 bacterium 34_10]|uniref:Transport permease protein n=1 Tax=candidate division WS6 bacterium 34_10 TaxID=1641389 RepID=A0A101HJ97_9BACT|nr:MAG: Polysaccharide ABC superfamily ATP binding cassette transporter permease [candidate division WS6 bacterium 34_10]
MISKNDIDLYKQFVKTIFKMRYKGSILGFLWVLLKPFFMFLILFVVFSSISGQVGNLTSQQYAVYLLSGLVIYTFFQEGITWGLNSIMERAGLIVKINFKREIVVISALTMALINFGINLLIIGVIGTVLGVQFSLLGIAYILLIGLVMFLGMYGIAFFTSIWMVYVRDLAHIMELVLQLMFYASAVFFPIEMIPEQYQFIVRYNPIALFIQAVREALINQNIMNVKFVLLSLLLSIILIIIGNKYFKKKILKVAENF